MKKLNILNSTVKALFTVLLVIGIFSVLNAQDPLKFIQKNQVDKMQNYVVAGGDLGQKYVDILSSEDGPVEVEGYLINFAYAYDRKEIFEIILSGLQNQPEYSEQISACITQMISKKDSENLKRLISNISNINYRCDICFGIYPIHAALANSNGKMLDDILALNPDLTVLDARGLSVLHYAIWGEHFDLFKKFVEEDNFDIWNGSPENSILFAAAGAKKPEFLKYLVNMMRLDEKFNINVSDSLGMVPLHIASYSSLENCKFLILNGASAEFVDIDGYNSLHYAAWNGKSEIVKYFLDEIGLDPNDLTDDDYNPMILAVESGDLQTVKLIAEKYDGTYYKTVLKTAKKLSDKSIYEYLKPLLKY